MSRMRVGRLGFVSETRVVVVLQRKGELALAGRENEGEGWAEC